MAEFVKKFDPNGLSGFEIISGQVIRPGYYERVTRLETVYVRSCDLREIIGDSPVISTGIGTQTIYSGSNPEIITESVCTKVAIRRWVTRYIYHPPVLMTPPTTPTGGELDDYYRIGWNAGGHSIESNNLVTNILVMSLPVGIKGVAIGVSQPVGPYLRTKSYTRVRRGFMVQGNEYRLILNGRVRADLAQGVFGAGDQVGEFKIYHKGGKLRWMVDGDVVYSKADALFGSIDARAVSSFYRANDQITSAEWTINSLIDVSASFRPLTGYGNQTAEDYAHTEMHPLSSEAELTSLNWIAADVQFRPLEGTAFEAKSNYAHVEFHPLTSSAEQTPGIWSYGSMKPLEGYSGQPNMAESTGYMHPLIGDSALNEWIPYAGNSVFGIMAPLESSSIGITGGLIDSDTAFRELDGLSADYDYAESSTEMAPLFGFSYSTIAPDALIDVTLPGINMIASGVAAGRRNGVEDATLPGPGVTAYGGAQMDVSLPSVSALATADSAHIGRIDVTLPRPVSSLNAKVGSLGRINVSLDVKPRLAAQTGALINVRLPRVTALATSQVGTIGKINVSLQKPSLSAEASVGDVGQINVSLPGVSSRYGVIQATLSSPRLQAAMVDPITGETTFGVVMNLRNQRVTQYKEYPAKKVVRVGGRHLALTSTGVAEVSGYYDQQARYDWSFTLAKSDYGTQAEKRMPRLYIYGNIPKQFEVTLRVNDLVIGDYQSYDRVGEGILRVRLPRGVKGTYYQLTIQGEGGDELYVTGIAPLIQPTERKA